MNLTMSHHFFVRTSLNTFLHWCILNSEFSSQENLCLHLYGSIGYHALGPELQTHACDDMIQLQCNSTSQFTCLDMQFQFHCCNSHRFHITHVHHCFQSSRQCIPEAHDLTIRARPEVIEHQEVNVHIMTHVADDLTGRTTAGNISAVEMKKKQVTVI